MKIKRENTDTYRLIIPIIKKIVLFLSCFYLTVYVPFSFILYTPGWYRVNCNWHSRCEKMGYERVDKGISELSRFFRHQGSLESFFWTGKEKAHLMEVRRIADSLFLLSILALAGFMLTFHATAISRYALMNSILIFCLLAVLPVFAVFWRDIFHPLLFQNNLWINTHFDFSYYIMPRQFFKITTACLILTSSAINLLIWFCFRKNSYLQKKRAAAHP